MNFLISCLKNNKSRHCEEERPSNPGFTGPLCIVWDCFVPRNDAFLYYTVFYKTKFKQFLR
jgi:hypothetical protein